MNNRKVESVIVSFDISDKEPFILVGKKKYNKPVEVINYIGGDEAIDIWKRLNTVKTKVSNV